MTAENTLVPHKIPWMVRLWQSLTRAHSSIHEKSEIRRAQLLSGLTLVFSIATGMGTISSFFFRTQAKGSALQADLYELAALFLAFFLAYVLSRTRYITIASIFIFVALIVSTVVISLNTQFDLGSAFFITVPLIFVLGIGLLSQRRMWILFSMVFVGTLSIWLLKPNIELRTYIQTMGIMFTIGFLSLVVVTFKDNVERDRLDELKSTNLELEAAKQNLEQRINERTSELQVTKGQIEKRAEELQLISEVGRIMSVEQDIDKLLPLISSLVSERFGFYHVGIFLLDESGKYAVLKASNSTGGQRMLERGHRLEVGQVGIVGNVAASGQPRIASEVGEDSVFFNNPDLPETQSEIALPLLVRKRIIGVVDVQSKEPNAFPQERANTLEILADQIAIAIENSRLFSETQEALTEAQAFSQQFSTQAWERVTREKQIGYLHTINGDLKVNEPIHWEEAQQAIKDGEMVILPPDIEMNQIPALAIPLRVREQTIGVLDVRSTDPSRVWQKEEIDIIQAIADRVGLALENARLFEETTTRANRERTVSEITTHIRSINDPDIMLETALKELKRALGANDIQIRPYSPPPSGKSGEQPPLPQQSDPPNPV
jgi:GAF domain-containing protein